MTPQKAGRVKITVRLDVLTGLMDAAGIRSDAELARRMKSGVTASTVWKMRRANYTVNAAIIAGLLNVFPKAFELLFIVTDEDAQAAA